MPVLYTILGLFAVLIAVVIIRTLCFKPKAMPPVKNEKIELDEAKIIADMSDMIKCKTVSYADESLVDRAEFTRFEALLAERFPLIHKKCTLEKVGKTGLLYCLKGKSSEKPSVCMAHYDVVPIEEEGWDTPAFDGIVKDGYIIGRGTLDTKGTLCGIMEALEKMLADGFTPANDLYLSFSGEEETSGDTCPDIVSHLEKMGVKPAIVLDEGGAVVNKVFPGVKKECALIGTGEKGFANVRFSMETEGGHASTPPMHTICGKLAKAITRIENKPFKYQLTKPAAEMFDAMGRNASFPIRMLFANLWLFGPLLNLYGKIAGGEIYALLHTTAAVTCMEGSKAYNVLPPKASFAMNMRLLGKDNLDSVMARLRKTAKNDKIKIELMGGMNPSIYSDTSCEEWGKLTSAIHETWEDAIVSPYLMMACSDSRHYCRITDRVYRFSAMRLSKEERAMIHGNNERIPIETLIKTVEFYVRFIKLL